MQPQSLQDKDSFELFYIQYLFKRIFLQFPKEPQQDNVVGLDAASIHFRRKAMITAG